MAYRDVSDVLDEYSGLSRKVLEYCQLMKQFVDKAEEPGFPATGLAPLAAMVAVDEFGGRVGYKKMQKKGRRG